jgi:tRNA threonylcarbamoyladenosine biosynthesis protein TsaE
MSDPPSPQITIRTCSEAATRDLARRLATGLNGGEAIGLSGDLGAGKTVFVQGLARGLEVTEPVTSPSFVIVHHYAGRLRLCHVDLYRLDSDQVEGLGLDELIAPDAVVAAEWSERLPPRLRRLLRLDIAIEFGRGEHERNLRFSATGRKGEDLVRGLAGTLGASDEVGSKRGRKS